MKVEIHLTPANRLGQAKWLYCNVSSATAKKKGYLALFEELLTEHAKEIAIRHQAIFSEKPKVFKNPQLLNVESVKCRCHPLISIMLRGSWCVMACTLKVTFAKLVDEETG